MPFAGESVPKVNTAMEELVFISESKSPPAPMMALRYVVRWVDEIESETSISRAILSPAVQVEISGGLFSELAAAPNEPRSAEGWFPTRGISSVELGVMTCVRPSW